MKLIFGEKPKPFDKWLEDQYGQQVPEPIYAPYMPVFCTAYRPLFDTRGHFMTWTTYYGH